MDERSRRYVERLDRLRERPLAQQLEDDIAPFRHLSLEERARVLESVCAAAWKTLSSRPDFETAAKYQVPLSAESSSTWRKLVQQAREGRRQRLGGGRG